MKAQSSIFIAPKVIRKHLVRKYSLYTSAELACDRNSRLAILSHQELAPGKVQRKFDRITYPVSIQIKSE